MTKWQKPNLGQIYLSIVNFYSTVMSYWRRWCLGLIVSCINWLCRVVSLTQSEGIIGAFRCYMQPENMYAVWNVEVHSCVPHVRTPQIYLEMVTEVVWNKKVDSFFFTYSTLYNAMLKIKCLEQYPGHIHISRFEKVLSYQLVMSKLSHIAVCGINAVLFNNYIIKTFNKDVFIRSCGVSLDFFFFFLTSSSFFISAGFKIKIRCVSAPLTNFLQETLQTLVLFTTCWQ